MKLDQNDILLMGRFHVLWQDELLVDHATLDLGLGTHSAQV